MLDLKKKALGGISQMLEGRMADRLKPKPSPEPEDGSEAAEDMNEGPEVPGHMDAEDNKELSMEVPDGADLSKLSPEEKQQLQELYAKMGC